MYNLLVDHFAVVAAARAKCESVPRGPERAYATLTEACLVLQTQYGEDAGLLYKPDGMQHRQRSIDTIVYKDGTAFDALVDADEVDGPSRPDWRPSQAVDPGRWRAPVLLDVPDVPDTPDVPQEPDNPCVEHCVFCREALAVMKAQHAAANEQRQLMVQMLAKLPTWTELQQLLVELRQNPLPVKMRW